MMIAEKEIVLTFLLQLLSEHRNLDRLAFKGGTCLRKMFIGSHARFSIDLDFTALGEHDHEDVILAFKRCPSRTSFQRGLESLLKRRPPVEEF
jgi:predicted nucleotidyltransferase component of viral defense system